MYAAQYTSSFEIDPKGHEFYICFMPVGAMLLHAVLTHKDDRQVVTVYFMATREQWVSAVTHTPPDPALNVGRHKYIFHIAPAGYGDLPSGLPWCMPLKIEGSDPQCPYFLFYAIQP